MPKVVLHVQPGEYAICRLLPSEPVPPWAGSIGFSAVVRTDEELSILCAAPLVPSGVRAEHGWRMLKLAGPFPFGAVGILASVLTPLAAAGISSLAVATFDTDYLLVKADQLDDACRAIESAGHTVRRA